MTEIRTRDFSRRPRRLEFTADGDTFTCHPALPPETLQELLALSRGRLREDFGAITELFDLVMDEENAARMRARLANKKQPLDIGQVLGIVQYLVEEYTSFPTTSPADSSTGSPVSDAGDSSTVGAPVAA